MSLLTSTVVGFTNRPSLREQLAARRDELVRRNSVIPLIIVIAIIVLLILAASITIAAMIVCSQHGAVYDTYASLKNGTVQIKCHKL